MGTVSLEQSSDKYITHEADGLFAFRFAIMFDSFNDSPGNRKKTNLSSISPDELFEQVKLLFSLYICVLHK